MKKKRVFFCIEIALLCLLFLWMWLSFYPPGWYLQYQAQRTVSSIRWSQVEAAACAATYPGVRYLLFSDLPGEENPFRPVMETLRLPGPVEVPDDMGGQSDYTITLLLTGGDTVELRFLEGSYSGETGLSTGYLLGSQPRAGRGTRTYAAAEIIGLRALAEDPALQITCEAYNALSWVQPVLYLEDGAA